MIIRDDVRFEGFDAAQWASLLALLQPDSRGRHGTLLVALDESRRVLNATILGRGMVTLPSPTRPPSSPRRDSSPSSRIPSPR